MKHRVRYFLLAFLLSLSLAFPAFQASEASAPAGPFQQGEWGEQLAYNPETGQLIFVGASPDQPIPSPAGEVSTLSAEEQAMAFVAYYGPHFGLKQPANEVRLNRVDEMKAGNRVIRYQQTYQGVPVFGGDLVVDLTDSGALLAMAGKVALLPPDLDVTPTVAAEDAAQTARSLAARLYRVAEEKLTVSEPGLWIFDKRLFTQSTLPPQLVWKVDVIGRDATRPVYEVVLVNAKSGEIAIHYTNIDLDWPRPKENLQPLAQQAARGDVSALTGGSPVWEVYDAYNDYYYHAYDPFGYVGFICSNGSPSGCDDPYSDDWEAVDARDYTLDTYDFYWIKHGRDSINGAGMPIISTIHFGDPYGEANWFMNAFWDGSEMVYGDWMAIDDVVAHELTHGVTQHTSGLIYLYQSGAINESLSDVWGELVDLSYDHDYVENGDTVARWLLGEDLFGPTWAFRNMKNPPAKGDPDSMTSPLYYKGPFDNGGVHTNSGVNNKAVYLMTDGGTFNGYTITGLGIDKVARIYYKAQTERLFPAADYFDLYLALISSCNALYGVGSFECSQVIRALQAVKMDKKVTGVSAPVVTDCPLGLSKYTTLFSDNFDSGSLAQWTLAAREFTGAPLTPSWTIAEGMFDSLAGGALYAPGPIEIANPDVYDVYGGEEMATTATPISLPAGAKVYLTFDHMYLFEAWSTYNWDGGVLEYSTDGGLTWKDAKPLFNAGVNYNGTIYKWPSIQPVNPLGGRSAFVRNGWHDVVRMRYNLSSLAGKNVLLRFHAGYDYFTDWGWAIDNVDVHLCLAVPNVPALLLPANGALVYDYTPRLDWANAAPDVAYYQVQIATNNLFDAPVYDTTTTDSEFTVPTDLNPNTKYYWRVRAFNALDQAKTWSAVRYFRTAMTPPVLTAPADGAFPMTDRPNFDWEAVDGATGYTLQVSKNAAFTQIVHSKTVAAPITAYTPTLDLPGGMMLYWRVKANGANPSDWSEVRSFTSGNPPSVPVLLSPANNALITNYTPCVDWAMSLVPPGAPDFREYGIQVDDDPDFSSPAIEVGIGGQGFHMYCVDESHKLAPNTKYYWRVNAWNVNSEYSGWSAVRSFRTAVTPPTLLSPANGADLLSNRPTFDWDDVPGATGYTLQISTLPTFSSLLASVTVAPSTYTPPTDLPPNKTLYWRVRANAVNGPSAWSETWSFVTANPPSIPVLLTPLQGARVTSLTPTLDWKDSTLPVGVTLDHYQIQVATDAGFTTIIYDENTGNVSQFTVPAALNANTKYYWRVRAYNTDGEYSAWSAARYFLTPLP